MIGAVKSTAKNVQDGIINAIKNLPNTLSNLGKKAITNLEMQSVMESVTS